MARKQIHASVELSTIDKVEAIKNYLNSQDNAPKVPNSQLIETLILKGIEESGYIFASTVNGLIADTK